jgi:gp16 family phage-associated protein
MDVLFHEDLGAYSREYQQARAAFISNGTTLQAWLDANGYNRQLAYRALKGRSYGRKSIELRAAVLKEAARLRSLG